MQQDLYESKLAQSQEDPPSPESLHPGSHSSLEGLAGESGFLDANTLIIDDIFVASVRNAIPPVRIAFIADLRPRFMGTTYIYFMGTTQCIDL